MVSGTNIFFTSAISSDIILCSTQWRYKIQAGYLKELRIEKAYLNNDDDLFNYK